MEPKNEEEIDDQCVIERWVNDYGRPGIRVVAVIVVVGCLIALVTYIHVCNSQAVTLPFIDFTTTAGVVKYGAFIILAVIGILAAWADDPVGEEAQKRKMEEKYSDERALAEKSEANKKKSDLQAADVLRKTDKEPEKEIAKPKNERPFTWADGVLVATFIGTIVLVFIIWDSVVGVYHLRFGSFVVPICIDVFIAACFLATVMTCLMAALLEWLGLHKF